MAILADLTQAELIAIIERQRAANQRKLTMKVTAKRADGTGTEGALSIYGLGRFPVTLYRGQWERLLAASADITAFITDNADLLATKD